MGKERDRILHAIEEGDVVFAVADDGRPKILLVYATSKDALYARLVTSQTKIELGRDGRSRAVDGDYNCTVLSAAPLDPNSYATVLGLDRKMRLVHSLDHIRLSEDEKRVLIDLEAYYKSRPLPD
jgi:hypothetical protein